MSKRKLPYKINKDNKPSEKMDEFLNKVDALCFEYGFEFYPTVGGWNGKRNENGEYNTFVCVGNDEGVKLLYLDGDGRGR